MITAPAHVLSVFGARVARAVAALVLFTTLGCAPSARGASSTVPPVQTISSVSRSSGGSASQGAIAGRGTAESPLLLCHVSGAEVRSDYGTISRFRCPDGVQPLGGDPRRGQAARLGNVGPGPDGHIVDLYEVPCSSGPIRIYVDAYHCPEGVDDEIDMSRLSRSQLTALASRIRDMHHDLGVQAGQMRIELLTWALETPQLTVVVCQDIFALVPGGAESSGPYMGELLLSYAAAVIEDGRDPADPVGVTVRALQGVLVYYQSLLAMDPSMRDPQMDQLLATAQAGGLPALVQRLAPGCGTWDRLGVHYYR